MCFTDIGPILSTFAELLGQASISEKQKAKEIGQHLMEMAETLIKEGAPREETRSMLKLLIGNLEVFYPQKGLLTLIINLRNLIAQNHLEVKVEG